MSLNDKVKVLWKTNCQWRDRPHWPKRKEIKLPQREIEETSTMPLKTGDRVKIKFGSRWYDAEVAEDWQAKSKKSFVIMLVLFWIYLIYLSPVNFLVRVRVLLIARQCARVSRHRDENKHFCYLNYFSLSIDNKEINCDDKRGSLFSPSSACCKRPL